MPIEQKLLREKSKKFKNCKEIFNGPYSEDFCPVCDIACHQGCRCRLNDRTCDNGHFWRRDDEGKAIILDAPHGQPIEIREIGRKALKQQKFLPMVEWAKRELELAGLFDKDSDYDGELGKAVMDIINTFSNQHFSGFSASMAIQLLNKLLNYKPITDCKHTEWACDVSNYFEKPMLQCTRCTDHFSNDGGATWWFNKPIYHKDENGVSCCTYEKVLALTVKDSNFSKNIVNTTHSLLTKGHFDLAKEVISNYI